MKSNTEQRMPALFISHGNPMLSITEGPFTDAWKSLGEELPQPQAILVISAHWYVGGTRVTAMPFPRTIHDFGGFPTRLFQVEYPAPGAPSLAEKIKEILADTTIELDHDWGLDHGSWTILRHLYPEADIPVLQFSLDRHLSAQEHYQLGRQLAPLREQGVLIIGSGNIVHNLAAFNWSNTSVSAPDWAAKFETSIRSFLDTNDNDALINYRQMGRAADLSVPDPDHFLPLLYIAALRDANEKATYPIEGFDGGTMSMLSVQFG